MNRKEIIKFVNETISNKEFDFLGLKQIHEEEDNYLIMNEYEFQQAFLYDLLFNPSKIEISSSGAEIKKSSGRGSNDGEFNIEYSVDVEYEYNEKKYNLEIMFNGENVSYKVVSSEHDGRKSIIIDWESIDYEIYSGLGDLIDFHIFEKIKDERLERSFIKEFIGLFIEDEILT